MTHTTRYGNTYTDQEWSEMQAELHKEGERATEYFVIRDSKIEMAAGFLNREFLNVPIVTWSKAIHEHHQFDREPKEIKFTSVKKEERFKAALKWIDSEIEAGLAKI